MQEADLSQSSSSPLLQQPAPEIIVRGPRNTEQRNTRPDDTTDSRQQTQTSNELRNSSQASGIRSTHAYEGTDVEMSKQKGGEDNEEVLEEEEKTRRRSDVVAPDGGWAWIVLIGASVVMMLVSMIAPCFSLVFSDLLKDLGSSSTTIAWIFNTFILLMSFIGPFIGPLTKELGHRPVAMVGALFLTLAVISSAFATSAGYLLVCFSLLGGIGLGILVVTSTIIIPIYFSSRLGRANGLVTAGGCLGQLLAPHLITYLQKQYAFMGATLILGGITLHNLACAVTFQPVQWHTCKVGHSGSTRPMLRRSTSPQQPMTEPRDGCNGSQTSFQIVKEPGIEQKENQSSPGTKAVRNRSTGHVWVVGFITRVAKATWHDLCILKSPRALLISICSSLMLNAYLNFLMMVPFMMEDAGHSKQDAAWCICVSALWNLVSRLLMSALTDTAWFSMHICYVAGIFLVAVSTLAFPFFDNMTLLMVTISVWGAGMGIFIGLYSLIMIRYMGKDNLPSMFGAASLLNGCGFISLGPLLGMLRDESGSYALIVWILSGTQFLCLLIWVFLPRITRPLHSQSHKDLTAN